jgi:hypothetical protein
MSKVKLKTLETSDRLFVSNNIEEHGFQVFGINFVSNVPREFRLHFETLMSLPEKFVKQVHVGIAR